MEGLANKIDIFIRDQDNEEVGKTPIVSIEVLIILIRGLQIIIILGCFENADD